MVSLEVSEGDLCLKLCGCGQPSQPVSASGKAQEVTVLKSCVGSYEGCVIPVSLCRQASGTTSLGWVRD